MDINEQGAVFHPLNGSGAKGTTGRSNASRRKQKERILPKGYPSRIGALHGCTVARNHLHWSTFSFSESRTAVFFSLKRKSGFGPSRAGKKSKRKAVEASAGQAATSKTEKGSLSAEGKSRFVKFLCRADKISAPAKVRWLAENRLPARATPHPQGGTAPTGHKLSLSGIAAKRRPAPNGWAVDPAGQANAYKCNAQNRKTKGHTRIPCAPFSMPFSFLQRGFLIAACAAASRATGTRKGEQDT